MRIEPSRSCRPPLAGPRNTLRPAAALIGGVLLASCGDQGSSRAPATNAPQYGLRDSAGIRIAENPRPAPESRLGWTVSPEPLISIGTPEGDSTFQLPDRVSDATRLPDGSVVVANGGSPRAAGLRRGGEPSRFMGRQGRGAGRIRRAEPGTPMGRRLAHRRRPRAGPDLHLRLGGHSRTDGSAAWSG